ncbi:hypothetical protein AB0O90_17075 [Microbacterium testaceum]|uniref:hypothetical protein n=1 Tax=Microbacterium testaceum TaxID=2033 RepID=UPI0034472A9D
MKSRPLSKPAAMAWAAFYAAGAVALLAGAVVAVFGPYPEYFAFVPKILVPLATFFTVAAVTTFMRRDPDAPTTWKDLARPFFASVTVLSGMLAALHPLWALGGVLGAGAATWAGLSNGWINRSIFKKETPETQDVEPNDAPAEDVEPTKEPHPTEVDAPLQEKETDGRDHTR